MNLIGLFITNSPKVIRAFIKVTNEKMELVIYPLPKVIKS